MLINMLVDNNYANGIVSGNIENHYCPTKIGFKNSVTLNSQRLQVKKSLFQNRG